MRPFPYFECDDKTLNDAFRIACGDVEGNVVPYRGGLLAQREPCLLAGLDYTQPWTRDAAINTWYALAMADGEVTKNTLLSVVETKGGKPVVAGSYGQAWDNAVWALGAREYLAFHDDADFCAFAAEVLRNTLAEYEETAFSEDVGLFSGRAVYADGIASYPDNVANKLDKEPLYALSTNCVFCEAYRICARLAQKCGLPHLAYAQKADRLQRAILHHFPDAATGLFDYFAHESDAQEALGLAYAVLFGIADKEQAGRFFDRAHATAHGIPCEWPPVSRYTGFAEGSYGRHSGTVWPMINGAWALAALRAGRADIFGRELSLLAEKAVRDLHFSEIYHPDSGLPYGGVQEWEGKIVPWQSCRKQTWSATAFLAMLYKGVAGIAAEDGNVTICPRLPRGVGELALTGIEVYGHRFDLRVVRAAGGRARAEGRAEDFGGREIVLSFHG